MAAFKNYEEYLSTFGSALEAAAKPAPSAAFAAPSASTPGIVPGAGQPPPLPPPTDPSRLGRGAFNPPHEQPPAAAPPAAMGGQQPASGEKGKNMRDLIEEASDEEREQFAKDVQAGLGVDDLEGKASEIAEKDPELAAQYKTGPADKKWDKTEAAAFLIEFGLRMMQAGGSGEGNFLSDVGSSALGAREAMTQKKLAEEEKADRARQREREDTEFGWKKEDRPGEVAETVAERQRRQAAEKRAEAESKRRQQAHEKDQKKGEWTMIVDKDTDEVVFVDPNTGGKHRTGIRGNDPRRENKVSAFKEQLNVWRNSASGGEKVWETMTPAEQSAIDQAFFEYQKTGVNSDQLRQKLIADLVKENDKKPERKRRTTEEIIEQVNNVFPESAPVTGAGGAKLGWE